MFEGFFLALFRGFLQAIMAHENSFSFYLHENLEADVGVGIFLQ